MPELIDRHTALEIAMSYCPDDDGCCSKAGHDLREMLDEIEALPTIEAEPVRHGRWVECDYKHLEHGFMETEPNSGLCCSECRTAFQKKKMTYKQYCAACGARMDGGADNA
jgi:hypothetical protein